MVHRTVVAPVIALLMVACGQQKSGIYDAAVARLRTAQADVAQATSQLESAQLKVDYTLVTAPISGRAGRARVTEGALVSASAATLLTTIEQLDPVYVNFSQSSAELLQVRQDIAQGRLRVPELRRVGVTSYLEVLDAERNLFAAEQTLLQLRRASRESGQPLHCARRGWPGTRAGSRALSRHSL